MATEAQPLCTLGEYLHRERSAAAKSEFYAGEVFAMGAGSANHSRLSLRIGGILDRDLDGCQVFDSNLKLYIAQAGQCVYPDAITVCGDPQLLDSRRDVLLNPSLVVEVLSPSTERYDQGQKAQHYRSLPALEHILLVSQEIVLVEHFERRGETWIIRQFSDRNHFISLLGIEVSVAEIYKGIIAS